MKTIIKAIVFRVGVDVLGFPQFHTHKLTIKFPKEKMYQNFIK